jgi:hypothetical protein
MTKDELSARRQTSYRKDLVERALAVAAEDVRSRIENAALRFTGDDEVVEALGDLAATIEATVIERAHDVLNGEEPVPDPRNQEP